MKIGEFVIEPWSRKNWLYRVIAILLVVSWVAWGLTIFYEGKLIEERWQAEVQLRQRQEEFLRRRAAYQHALEQQKLAPSRVQNAVDGVKR